MGIHVRNARTHNLRGVDLHIPRDGLVVLCGRSGSGKSSFAFDTLHAEGQRRYLDALSARVRAAVGSLPRPPVDGIDGLPPTVALSQGGDAPSSAASVASFSEVLPSLRVLFGRAGTLRCPASGEEVRPVSHDEILARLMALPEGTRLTLEVPVPYRGDPAPVLAEVARQGFSRVRVGDEVRRVEEVRPAEVVGALAVVIDRIRLSADRRERLSDAIRTAGRSGRGVIVAHTDAGVLSFVDRPYSVAADRLLPELSPSLFRGAGAQGCAACGGRGAVDGAACGACEGTGLGDVALAVRVGSLGWAGVVSSTVAQARRDLDALPRTSVTAPVLVEVFSRLDVLEELGLGAVPLNTSLATLSAGELQRVRLARQLSADLTGVLYILDEPTWGLDAERVEALIARLRGLVRAGNGVLVVEHHAAVIQAADRVIEFGPGPGAEGGTVIFEGSPAELRLADTPTGRALRGRQGLERVVGGQGVIRVEDARQGNLRGDAIEVLRGGLTGVSGPSGAGKSAVLVALGAALEAVVAGGEARGVEGAGELTRVISADELTARRSSRSMPATYVGLWDVLRDLYAATSEAQVRNLGASAFSLHVKGGRCEACRGLGVRTIDLGLIPAVDVPCEVCEGRRFASDVLEVRWRGLSAGDVLSLTADQAHPILAGHPKLDASLRVLRDVGLGYVPLGQPTDALSGGEGRRLRLARELLRLQRSGGEGCVVLLDEPTTGLHPDDVAGLHRLLRRLVEEGATVVVATHDAALLDACGAVLRVGPGSGAEGGRVGALERLG